MLIADFSSYFTHSKTNDMEAHKLNTAIQNWTCGSVQCENILVAAARQKNKRSHDAEMSSKTRPLELCEAFSFCVRSEAGLEGTTTPA